MAKSKPAVTPLPHHVAVANELHQEIFGGQTPANPSSAISPSFHEWLSTSKPFLAFSQNYLSKIRKKLRMCRDEDEAYNLFCELFTAYLLLQESKFAVAYEPYGKAQGRSADYAVTFRTNLLFHVEVTRLSAAATEVGAKSTENEQAALQRESRRLTDAICDKLGQLSPNSPNVLWVWSDSRVVLELEVGKILLALKQRIEQRDTTLYARYRLSKPADFIRNFQRLSAVLLVGLNGYQVSGIHRWWRNNDAHVPLPIKVSGAISAQLDVGS